MAQATALIAGLTDRFTAVPKTHDLVTLGVSPTATATYNALADHANNLTGECYPMMKNLARLLKRAEKTVQRHIDELVEAGLVEKIKRRRDKRGRFLGWLYRLPHLAAAAQRIKDRRAKNRKAYEERKKKQGMEREARRRHRSERKARSSKGTADVQADADPRQRRREGYAWFFGEEPADTAAELVAEEEKRRRREDEARERRRGYESLFDAALEKAIDLEESAASSTSSSGHQCPVGSNKSLTSREISIPPNPPRGAQSKEESDMKDPTSAQPELKGESTTSDAPSPEGFQRDGTLPGQTTPDRPPAAGSGGAVDVPLAGSAEPVGDAEAAWAAVIRALIERHKDGVPSWFGTYCLVSLSGLTLTVYLANFTLRNSCYGLEGRAADLTIDGYGKELAYLWRQVADDEDAVLELRRDGRPKGGHVR